VVTVEGIVAVLVDVIALDTQCRSRPWYNGRYLLYLGEAGGAVAVAVLRAQRGSPYCDSDQS